MRRLVFLLAIGMLPSLAAPCSMVTRKPGQAMPAPVVLFEGVVVEAHVTELPFTSTQTVPGTAVTIEISRSYQGPFTTGTRVRGQRRNAAGLCNSGPVGVGDHVMVWSTHAHAPFDLSVLEEGEESFALARLMRLSDAPGTLVAGQQLVLRGSLSVQDAKALFARTGMPAGERCEIRGIQNDALVICGSVFHGNDARYKVLFEKSAGRWTEVMRYELDGDTEARLQADADQSGSTTS
jgi:hypothetical protein